MRDWSNKQWGAVIGFLVIFSAALIGVGVTALAVLVGVLGYFVGKFLDGELSLQELQDRAQGRTRYPDQTQQGRARPPRVE